MKTLITQTDQIRNNTDPTPARFNKFIFRTVSFFLAIPDIVYL